MEKAADKEEPRMVAEEEGYLIVRGDLDDNMDFIRVKHTNGEFEKVVMGEGLAATIRACEESVENEEARTALQDIAEASLPFGDFRMRVRDALRAILSAVFKIHNLPKSSGLDVGCGATGAMVEGLLPLDEHERSSWTQIDVNPAAVAENHRRHPHSRIVLGSYLNLAVSGGKPPIITGLSCLDSTAFAGRAVQQIRDALVEGGFFLHFQDIQPGFIGPMQEVREMGEKFPFHAEAVPEEQFAEAGMPVRPFPENVMLYETNEGVLTVMELLRRRLSRAIQTVGGLEILEQDWFTAISTQNEGPRDGCFYNSGYLRDFKNNPIQIVSGIVTLARKI